MVNIFEADHGEQTTTREGVQQYLGARTKFAFWLVKYQIRLKLSEISSLTVLRNFHTMINAKKK